MSINERLGALCRLQASAAMEYAEDGSPLPGAEYAAEYAAECGADFETLSTDWLTDILAVAAAEVEDLPERILPGSTRVFDD